MIRKLGLSLLGITCLFSVQGEAAVPQAFRSGPAVEYVLNVNEPQVLANQFLWTIRAVCKIKCDVDDGNLISFKVLRKSGSLNGESLTVGDSVDVVVHNSDKIYISAVSGAQVELVNVGTETIKAECSVT